MLTIIMAGGKGTRISELFPDIPKPLIPIQDTPVLEREICSLRDQGFTDIILTISYMAEKIREYFGTGDRLGVKIEYFVEEVPLGNAGALFKLRKRIGNDPFLLLNADALFDVDFSRMVRFHKSHRAKVTLFTHPNSHPYDSGLLITDMDGRVDQWLTKEDKRPAYYKNRVNAGLHVINPEVLDMTGIDVDVVGTLCTDGKIIKVDLDRQILKPLCGTGQMFCYDSPEYVKDMGTPDRYEAVCQDFAAGRVKSKNLKQKQKAIFLDRDGTINKYVGFLRGAALQLHQKQPLRYGISAVIEGTLPIGGLSSSAAVIIAFMSALAHVNRIALDSWETIMMAKAAENKYVGVNCGKLDQSCKVLCKKDQLLYLDCADDSYQLIPWTGKAFGIAVFFSGLERSLATSAYNLRQDECKVAAYSLLAHAGLEYGKYADTRLRDVPAPIFEEYKDCLPANFRKRATHYFSEYRRTEEGAEAWRRGDLETYGKLIFESGRSSIENYECGCPELITLYNIMTETDGIYGGRFSGAGFKGCCMALVEPGKAEDVLHTVEERYLVVYPALKEKYLGVLCESADGVRL